MLNNLSRDLILYEILDYTDMETRLTFRLTSRRVGFSVFTLLEHEISSKKHVMEDFDNEIESDAHARSTFFKMATATKQKYIKAKLNMQEWSPRRLVETFSGFSPLYLLQNSSQDVLIIIDVALFLLRDNHILTKEEADMFYSGYLNLEKFKRLENLNEYALSENSYNYCKCMMHIDSFQEKILDNLHPFFYAVFRLIKVFLEYFEEIQELEKDINNFRVKLAEVCEIKKQVKELRHKYNWFRDQGALVLSFC